MPNTTRIATRHRSAATAGLQCALKIAGGQAPLGRLIGRAQPSVREWLVKGTRVSAEDAVKIEQATGVPAEAINPALAQFAEMRGLSVRPLPKAA